MPPATEEAARPMRPAPTRRISAGEKLALVPEVLVTYARARRELSRADLPTALRTLRGATAAADPAYSAANRLMCDRMAGAVKKTLVWIPARSKCLMQSLTLTAMLARRGVDTSLVIGVKPGQAGGGDSDDEFVAHAWVEYHGDPVLPVFRSRFERLTEV